MAQRTISPPKPPAPHEIRAKYQFGNCRAWIASGYFVGESHDDPVTQAYLAEMMRRLYPVVYPGLVAQQKREHAQERCLHP